MTIKWNTPAGRLGTLKELDYYEMVLSATELDNEPLEYTHLSGNLPPGMYITTDGKLKGVPTITEITTRTRVTYAFTVRANNPAGQVADRTFSIAVTNQSLLTIQPRLLNFGAFDNGSLLYYKFQAITDNPNATLTWSIVSGTPPPDIRTGEPMTVNSDGVFTGYTSRLVDTSLGTPGVDVEGYGVYPFDFAATGKDRVFNFEIQVTDGYTTDKIPVVVSIISKGAYTADNSLTIINNTSITVDSDNRYIPIVISDPTVIPVLQSGNKYSFKFEAVDPEDQTIYWRANTGIALTGLSISRATGWLSGTIPSQVEEIKTYTFDVYAYRAATPDYESSPLQVNITTLKDAANYISWTSPSNLGSIVNGSISEIEIGAVNNAGKDITYSLVQGEATLINSPANFVGYRYSDPPLQRLPQGLQLLPNGQIIGRASFQYFSLDNDSSSITIESTDGITVGMTVEGVGVASGSKVLEVINSRSVKIKPAIFVTQGTELTFRNLLTDEQVIARSTDLSTSTSIDGGKTTFDCTYKFKVKAITTDGTSSSTKEFTLITDNYNRAPYENIYLKALPAVDQRQLFAEIINNTDIFPNELIYRPLDPWFGKAKDIKILFLPGVTSSYLSAFAEAIQRNHYNKTINFGAIKTARAVDENFNTKYEVVYVEIEDDKQANGVSADLVNEPVLSNYYLYGNQSYYEIYPNSYKNMQYRLDAGVGYTNRGALPRWMTSPQENGRVLGLTRGVVLAYTVPGASKLIAYRLSNNGITFNNLQFVADRYQIDTVLSNNYNLETNRFYNNKEVTFDSLNSNVVSFSTRQVSTYTESDTITFTSSVNSFAYGSMLTPRTVDGVFQIPKNTYITKISGNTITVNNNVNLFSGANVSLYSQLTSRYAVSVQFDSIHNQYRDDVPTIDGVTNYEDGDTVVFIKQEGFTGVGVTNDGWNRPGTVYGYLDKIADPTKVNERASIWKINIDEEGLITLTVAQEILVGQRICIISGTSNANTFMDYGPDIPIGGTVPKYNPILSLAEQNDSNNRTRFDGGGTRFFDHKDKYALPETGDKYIKFPQIGVYR